jgi:hypothetical protein
MLGAWYTGQSRIIYEEVKMTTKVQDIVAEARQLSPVEQLGLIRTLLELLQSEYRQADSQSQSATQDMIPSSVARAKPVRDLDEYAADFWPDDESLDELNSYIQQQRTADRLSDQ